MSPVLFCSWGPPLGPWLVAQEIDALSLFIVFVLKYFQDRPHIISSDTFLRNVSSQGNKACEQDPGDPDPQRLQTLELLDITF